MKRGGRNVEDLTNNIMAKVFTDDLASDFSMRGKQKKKALQHLKVTSCIIGKYPFYLKSLIAILFSSNIWEIFVYVTSVLYFTEAIMASEDTKEDYVQKQMGKWLANAPVRLSRNK